MKQLLRVSSTVHEVYIIGDLYLWITILRQEAIMVISINVNKASKKKRFTCTSTEKQNTPHLNKLKMSSMLKSLAV